MSKEEPRFNTRMVAACAVAGCLGAGAMVVPVAISQWKFEPSAPDFVGGENISASAVNSRFQAIEQALVGLGDTLATGETASDACPSGYDHIPTVYPTVTLCARGDDELVRVGDFWIDRYEAVAVDGDYWNAGTCDANGKIFGTSSDNFPDSFPDNGTWSEPHYACSVPGEVPTRHITWFQAQQACALAGKHLCSNAEWQAAVAGTHDPGAAASEQQCNTTGSASRKTGLAGSTPGGDGSCVSHWGAEDMVGNLGEWVSLWTQAGEWKAWSAVEPGQTQPEGHPTAFSDDAFQQGWPQGYGDDGTFNIHGRARAGGGTTWRSGLPAALIRGGWAGEGVSAGAFATSMGRAPSYSAAGYGFRCCRSR